MLLIFWYILLPIALTVNVNSKKSKAKMNDFITEMMASEKFEELTDIIVNKAIKKMKMIGQDVTKLNKSEVDMPVVRHYNDEHVQKEENPSTKKKNEPLKLKQGNKNQNKTIVKNEKKSATSGKIDARTLLNDIPTEELLLSFKHLIESQKRKTTDKKETKKSKVNYASESNDDKSDNKNKKNDERGVNNVGKTINTHDYRDSSSSSDSRNVEVEREEEGGGEEREGKEERNRERGEGKEERNRERGEERESKKVREGKREKDIEEEETEEFKEELKDEEREVEREADMRSNESFKKVTKLQEYNKNEKSIEDPNQTFEKLRTNVKKNEANNTMKSNQSIKGNISSKEILEVQLVQGEGDNENKRSFTEETTKTNKRVHREENGKIFTFNSSPEYDEYHEKLAIERKKAKGLFIK